VIHKGGDLTYLWISIQKRSGKRGRLHLDLYTKNREAEVERPVNPGATRYPWRYKPGDDFVVLEDPDGNLFCVVQKQNLRWEWTRNYSLLFTFHFKLTLLGPYTAVKIAANLYPVHGFASGIETKRNLS